MGLGGDSGEKHGEAEEVPRLAGILLKTVVPGSSKGLVSSLTHATLQHLPL